MKVAGAKQQTVFLTGVNAAVRAMGLAMRVCLSRFLGPEIMGIMELAQSVHMIAIAPLTSGLPVAISRLTVKADPHSKDRALAAGLWLSKRISCFLIPLLWLASPMIARCMGDVRVLPSLWFTAPCILILGYSASYNGYCYGMERSDIPAVSELIEQSIRFLLTLALIMAAGNLTAAWTAAIPVAATMTAEILGLCFVLHRLNLPQKELEPSPAWVKAVYRLAAPATLNRLVQTFLRSATAILIPLRLHSSGLSISEATSQLGMLNGMVMPFLMLPGVFTSALSMVMIPRITAAEEKPSELGRLLKISLCSTMPLSACCAVLVFFGSPFLAERIYHQPDLIPLFQRCCWQMLLFPLCQILGSTLSALGHQRRVLSISFAASAFSLCITWLGAGSPVLRLDGIIMAQYASHFLSILLSTAALLMGRINRRPHKR